MASNREIYKNGNKLYPHDTISRYETLGEDIKEIWMSMGLVLLL